MEWRIGQRVRHDPASERILSLRKAIGLAGTESRKSGPRAEYRAALERTGTITDIKDRGPSMVPGLSILWDDGSTSEGFAYLYVDGSEPHTERIP